MSNVNPVSQGGVTVSAEVVKKNDPTVASTSSVSKSSTVTASTDVKPPLPLNPTPPAPPPPPPPPPPKPPAKLEYSVVLVENWEAELANGFYYKVLHLPTKSTVGYYATNVEASNVANAKNAAL